MFNDYSWKLYLKAGGQDTVEMFKRCLVHKMPKDFAAETGRLMSSYCTADIVSDSLEQIEQLAEDLLSEKDETYLDEGYISGAAASGDIDEEIDSWADDFFDYWMKEEGKEQYVFEMFISRMPYITTNVSILVPGVFVPYLYFSNYNVLTTIADTFGIDLPEIPKKPDYKGRFWHYAELCKAFYRFRQENHLDYYEFLAFLYDFAPNYIGGKESYIVQDLPEPKSAFFVGGNGTGTDAVAADDPARISFWQCNPNTRAGDLIVMYLRTPVSAITSIWRAKSVGFIDPFFYYYRCTYIGDPIKVDPISLNDIKKDPILGKMPIVNKNMQGINGVELRPSEYNHIVDITGAAVPKLEFVSQESDGSFENEKAVEEKLIKPLIARLGYAEDEYVQQMYIEIGNHNHALIPDFVLHPKSSKGHYSGFAIIEAKRSITSEKQMTEVKSQARSYAKLLGTKYSVIAAQEKVWVMSEKDDYTNCIFEESWDAISNADTLYELSQLIGNR